MPVSSHLTEYYHVFNDGSTGRLAVSPWTRETLADGYWINENTIKPLSARDVYLAECIQNLSAQDPVYKEGANVKIVKDDTDGKFIIAVDSSNVKINNFVASTPLNVTDNNGEITYSLNINDENHNLYVKNGKLDIDTSKISYDMSDCTATSAYQEYNIQTFNYTYSTATLNYEIVDKLPTDIVDDKLYILG